MQEIPLLDNRYSYKSYKSGKTFEEGASQPSSPSKMNRINDLKNQVECYLDMLESKVTLVKEKTLSEFIVAYNNYVRQVKEDLKYLKEKSVEIEKYYKDNDRIQGMEQQLEWFREESVKLYLKIENKNKDIFELKFKLQELKKENEFLENQIKQLLKKNKRFEVVMQSSIQETNKEPQLFCTQPRPKRILSSHVQSRHVKQVTEILEKQDDSEKLVQDLANYISIIENTQSRQMIQMKQKMNQAIGQSTKAIATRGEYEEFFIDCVEQVRKEIMRRRQNQNSESTNLSDYNIFRKEDKIRLLELVLTNDRLLQTLHQKMFPQQTSFDPMTLQTEYQDVLQIQDKKRSFSTKDRMIIKKGKLLYK